MDQNADTAFLAGRGRALIADLLAAQPRLTTSIGYDWNISVATFSAFIEFIKELKKKSGGAYALARAQSRTLLALIGYSNGLNFNDVICLVARTKRSGIGIFESNWTCLVPSVFIGFYGFYGFWGLSGKPSEQSFLIFHTEISSLFILRPVFASLCCQSNFYFHYFLFLIFTTDLTKPMTTQSWILWMTH